MKSDWGFETIAIHEGQEPDGQYGAVIPPLHLTTTYRQKSPGEYAKFDYSRAGNPTRTAYEACLARLEGGIAGFAFSSGCAATTTIMHLLKSGDHVIAGDDMYGGTLRLFEKVFRQQGIEFSYVDLREISQLSQAIKKNTKMIWLETPTNPTMKLIDIAAVCAKAMSANIMVSVDNTFMSPYFQNPLKLGATIVMHSATKYICGHSDVIGGAVVTTDAAVAEQFEFLNKSIGAVASPFDSYLALRSLKTLAVRMQAHEKNALAVAEVLSGHKKVDRLLYPGHKSHPQHALAKSQMRGFGGMMSFYLKGGLSEAKKFLGGLEVFTLAESLGGVESLIEHPAIMTHSSVPAERREQLGIKDGFIRMSVGIESTQDLVNDIKKALDKI